jgi:anti-sigma factor RsiW
MSCEKFSDSIGALIDGTLGPEAKRALDEHLKTCVACRTLAADLRRIHDEAGRLPRVEPPDALWAKVRARLEEQAHGHARWRWRERLAAWVAGPSPRPAIGFRLAAVTSAIVLVLAIGTGYVLIRQRTGQPGMPAARQATETTIGAPAGNAADQEFVQSVEMELRIAEEHYEKAIAGLEQIAKADEGSLDPQVAAVLQKNLGIIDQAIRDSRVALQSQPTSQVAQATLFEAFRRKVALLQDTITLVNEMRKGDQAGAARVLQNLNKG